jgi:tape measure domain-containing protein
MALSLGDITFGLGANTQGLQKAVDALGQFGRQLNQAAAAQNNMANAGVSAMARQEHAIRAALQQVMNLNAQIKRSEAPAYLMANNVRAFQKFSNEMTNGVKSATDFSRTQDWLAAQLGKSKRALADFQAQASAGKSTQRFNEILRDLQSASILAVGPLSGLGARITAIGQISGRSTALVAGFIAGVTGASVAVYKLSAAAIDAAKVMDTINTRMESATGSSAMASIEFGFVSDTSRQMGLDLKAAAGEYSRLAAATSGTALAGKQTREIFLGVSEAAVAMRLAPQQFERAMLAITQMVSKGKVSSEELRQQFGEHIPGALRIAAESLGVTTSKLFDMMEKGEVMANDFLPKFAQRLREVFGPGAEKGATSLQAAQNNLNSAILQFNLTLDRTLGISEAYKGALNAITGAVDGLRENITSAIGIVGGITGAMLGLAAPAIISGIVNLATALRTAAAAMTALNIAALANPVTGVVAVLARLGIAAAGAAGGYFLLKDSLEQGTVAQDNFIESIDKFLEKAGKAGGAFKSETAIYEEEIQKRIDLTQRELQAKLSALDEARKAHEQARNNQAAAPAPNLFGLDEGMSQFGPDPNQVNQSAEAVGTLETQVFNLSTQLGELKRRLTDLQGVPILGESGSLASKEFEKATEKIRDMHRELGYMTEAWSVAQTQGKASAEQLMDLSKAQEMLKKVPAGEMQMLSQLLKEMGFESTSTAEALAMLVTAHRESDESLKEFLKSLDEAPKKIKEAREEILKLQLQAEALRLGPTAAKNFDVVQKQADQIKRMREELEKAGVSQAEINQILEEYQRQLENVQGAQKFHDDTKKILDKIENGFDRAFDRIGETITEAFLKGESAAIDFNNLMQSIASEIMQTFLEIALLDPIKQGAKGLFENILTSEGGSFLGSLFGAKGMIMSGGKLTKFAHGGVLNKPTAFPMANGMGVAREAGRNEAILPLTMTSGGDLGVKALSASGGVVINIINNVEGTTARTEQRNDNGTETIDVVIDRVVAGSIRSGGMAAQAIEQRYGLGTQLARRG